MKDLKTDNTQLATWLLRVGLAFVFFYAAISSLQHPLEWEGYFPTFLAHLIAAGTLVKLFAVVEVLLAAWLLVGKYTRYAAALATVMLLGIIVANPSQLIITFRDVGLALAAAALALLSPAKK